MLGSDPQVHDSEQLTPPPTTAIQLVAINYPKTPTLAQLHFYIYSTHLLLNIYIYLLKNRRYSSGFWCFSVID